MLVTAFRQGLRAARRSGWRAFALALLSYVPIAVSFASPGGVLLFPGLVLHVVVVLALTRLLGAVDGNAADALRQAARLWRPAIGISGLYVLAQFAALLTVVAVSGGRVGDYSPTAQLVTVLPVSALFLAFVVLATQRVGLEGDPRVLVAAAHSVRIARQAYGALLLLTLAEPVVATAGALSVPGEHPPAGRVAVASAVTLLVATVVKVLVTATANEVYASGPRLDLPVAEPPG